MFLSLNQVDFVVDNGQRLVFRFLSLVGMYYRKVQVEIDV